MKLLPSLREQIAAVAEQWKTQQNVNDGALGQAIYVKLCALPADATAADVAAIIGNDSWIGYDCDECNERVSQVFQLGQEPDYEGSNSVVICHACVDKLIALRHA